MNILSSLERKHYEQIRGYIFDIQRYSVHDGPGLRTNVFFKGCPLRCAWCSNPESQQLQPQLALLARQCMRCDLFVKSCASSWQHDHSHGWNSEYEAKYRERAAVCPTGAMHWIGEERTAGDVFAEVRRDKPFYNDGGGMTLSGGDAVMQPQMAEALLRLAKAEGISTAIETCGQCRWEVWQALLPYLDHILFDVKHVDSEVHRKFTGVGNQLILSNLQQLMAKDAPLTIRIPLIPGCNASEADLRNIIDVLLSMNQLIRHIDVLPYHTFGKTKYAALGRQYPWEQYARLTDEELTSLCQVVASYGMSVNIGG